MQSAASRPTYSIQRSTSNRCRSTKSVRAGAFRTYRVVQCVVITHGSHLRVKTADLELRDRGQWACNSCTYRWFRWGEAQLWSPEIAGSGAVNHRHDIESYEQPPKGKRIASRRERKEPTESRLPVKRVNTWSVVAPPVRCRRSHTRGHPARLCSNSALDVHRKLRIHYGHRRRDRTSEGSRTHVDLSTHLIASTERNEEARQERR
jgi:hypothetical protein